MSSARLSVTARFAILIWTIVISWSCFPKSVAAQGFGTLTHDPEGDATSALCFDYGYGVTLFGEHCDVFLQAEIMKDTNSKDMYTLAFEIIFANGLVSNGWYAMVTDGIYENNLSPSYIPPNSPTGTNNTSFFGSPAAETPNGATPYPITLGNTYESVAWGYLQNIYYHTCNGGTIAIPDPCPTSNNPIVRLFAIPPNITSIGPPTYGYVGTSGQIKVVGTNLVDPFTEIPRPSFNSGSGVTFPNLAAASSDNVALNYTIAQNATTGPRALTLQTLFGTATSSQTFNVGDPTPDILTVGPIPLVAGTMNLAITITGSRFGTNPQLTFPPASGVTLVSQGTSGDNSISAVVNISSGAQNGPVAVTVKSMGYYGNPWVPATSGDSQTTSKTVMVVGGITAPVPQLQLFGTTLTSSLMSPYPVVVGQLIGVTETTGPLPSGYSYVSQTWSLPNGDTTPGSAVGGYTNPNGGPPDTTGGCVFLIQGQSSSSGCNGIPASTTGSSFNFYYVSAFTATPITYTYTATDTAGDMLSETATAWFSVAAPAGVSVLVTPASTPVSIVAPNIVARPEEMVMSFGLVNRALIPGLWGMTFGATTPGPGSPSGTYQWVQLVASDASRDLLVMLGQSPVNNSIIGNPALDNTYPYGIFATGIPIGTVQGPLNDLAADTPTRNMFGFLGETARSFSAQMYLMWVPSAGITGCTLLCEIPVPLGVVYWQYSGDAINTGRTMTVGGRSVPDWTTNGPGWLWTSGYIQLASFPVWTTTITSD